MWQKTLVFVYHGDGRPKKIKYVRMWIDGVLLGDQIYSGGDKINIREGNIPLSLGYLLLHLGRFLRWDEGERWKVGKKTWEERKY